MGASRVVLMVVLRVEMTAEKMDASKAEQTVVKMVEMMVSLRVA